MGLNSPGRIFSSSERLYDSAFARCTNELYLQEVIKGRTVSSVEV